MAVFGSAVDDAFQSTPPLKAVTWIAERFPGLFGFQSTPPLKAVTEPVAGVHISFAISIHTAPKGGDG